MKRKLLFETWWRGGDEVEIPPSAEEAIPTATVSVSADVNYLTATYTYSDVNSDLEDNERPEVRDFFIGGTPKEGNTLTGGGATYYSKNNYAFSSASYQWYRADNQGGVFDHENPLTLISGATSSTYTCTSADIGKYIFCRLIVTQSGGGNTTSLEYYANTTDTVLSAVFDPTELGFGIALLPSDMSDDGTTFTWTNTGSKGGSITATGTARPTIVSDKADFDGNDRVVGAIMPASTGRYEVWLRAKFDDISVIRRPYVLGNDNKTLRNTTATPKQITFGSTNLNSTSGTPALDTNERIYRVRFDGIGGKRIQVDKNIFTDTYYIDESFTGQNNQGLIENQNLVLGSNLAGTLQFFDGTIDYLLVLPNNHLTEDRADLMWDYIQNN